MPLLLADHISLCLRPGTGATQTSIAITKRRVFSATRLALTAGTVALLFLPEARACIVKLGSPQPTSSLQAFAPLPEASSETQAGEAQTGQENDSNHRRVPLVGTWTFTFYADGKVWDVAIEQFSSDGNEMDNDIAVEPNAGNICWGIWKPLSHHAYKLEHIGWTFDKGVYFGRFDVVAKLEVAEDGHTLQGKWVADQEDLAGNFLPAFHAEGTLKGVRFTGLAAPKLEP